MINRILKASAWCIIWAYVAAEVVLLAITGD